MMWAPLSVETEAISDYRDRRSTSRGIRRVMNVAIVSCGLAHVCRGIEAWALDLAEGLATRWRGRKDQQVTLFCGSSLKSEGCSLSIVAPCLRRGTPANRLMTRLLSRAGGWRFGFGSEYQTEQTTMAPFLIHRIRKFGCDIVHLQDPWLAWLLQKARRKGGHHARVILAHGTEEPMEFLQRFDFLQELSPPYADRHAVRRNVFMIPNFVDTKMFCGPVAQEERRLLRKKWGLPPDAFIAGSVGAVDCRRKRMDLLVKEFSRIKPAPSTLLAIAGARTEESPLVEKEASRTGCDARFFYDVPRECMPEFYKMLDIFVLLAERELFGIAFIEAMASGIPCVAHANPVSEWILGEGGMCVEAGREGAVAAAIADASDEGRARIMGQSGRERCEKIFSREKVVGQIAEMYERVMWHR